VCNCRPECRQGSTRCRRCRRHTVRRTVIASRTTGETPVAVGQVVRSKQRIKGHRQKAMRTRLEAASPLPASDSFERIKPCACQSDRNLKQTRHRVVSLRPLARRRGLTSHLASRPRIVFSPTSVSACCVIFLRTSKGIVTMSAPSFAARSRATGGGSTRPGLHSPTRSCGRSRRSPESPLHAFLAHVVEPANERASRFSRRPRRQDGLFRGEDQGRVDSHALRGERLDRFRPSVVI